MCLISLLVFASLSHLVHSIPNSQFFPSGLSAGDLLVPVADDSFAGPINLSWSFPFFGVDHSKVWVNNNGAISFQAGITTFTPVCGAMHRQSKMIAPFWADVDTRRGGNIYYRETTEPLMLAMVSDQIRRAYPNWPELNMNWAFLATWHDVAFYNSLTQQSPDCNSDARNTFQLTITTDGMRSFAIFYYDQLTWTTGTASQGNCSGLGGTQAKAGFDVGDGSTFFELPESCTDNVLNLAHNGNVGEPGVWVYRIDNNLEPPPSSTEQPSSPVLDSEATTCPPPIECSTGVNSCGTLVQEMIGHVVTFLNRFSSTCLGELDICSRERTSQQKTILRPVVSSAKNMGKATV